MKRFSIIFLILFILFCAVTPAPNAATYHVKGSCTNAGDGSSGDCAASPGAAGAFITISACSSAMSALGDDTCFIHAGPYSENVTPKSGTEGHKNTYAAYQNGTVIITGTFSLSNKQDVRVIGFEFKNTSTYTMLTYNALRCDVLYNYFHNTGSTPIRDNNLGYNTLGTRYLTLRGNTFDMTGCLESATETCSGALILWLMGNHNLIEYNTFTRPGGDFISVHFASSIIRNNKLSDFTWSNFPGNSGTSHVDAFQIYATSTFPMYNLFIDSNYVSNLHDTVGSDDTHLFQLKRTTTATEHDNNWRDLTIRGNVGNSIGSYGHEFSGVNGVRIFNNTFVDIGGLSFGTFGINSISIGHDFNNLFYDANSSPIDPYSIAGAVAGTTVTASNNACVIGSTHASCAVNTDPLFTNYAAKDFTIQTGSPAKNAGKAITLANGAGDNTTTLVVDDAEYFTDGFGLTGGDIIKIGANNPVTITSINYTGAATADACNGISNCIIISTAQSWADNAEIYWRDQDTTPDIGAWEYKASHALTGTWALSEGTVTVTPNDASLVRFVEVSENGVPVGTDYTSPYTVSGVGAGLVTVRMFSLHASATPIVMATLSGDETAPTLQAVTPIATPSANTTPEYVFSSNEAGTITYGGTCSTGSLANAINGNNTVTWTLAPGTYSNCTITVNDGTNSSDPLAVAEFVITGTPVYTLTVTKTGAGCSIVSSPSTAINCGSTCSASIGANTEIALYGLSGNNWTDVVFGGDCSTGGTVTLSEARTCTATCTKISPDVAIGSGAAVTLGSGAVGTIH